MSSATRAIDAVSRHELHGTAVQGGAAQLRCQIIPEWTRVGSVVVSRWTCVEFSSLLAKDVRIGTLTSAQAVAIDAAFDAFVTSTCRIIDVTRRDFDVARQFLADHRSGLRSGDALHLAIACNNAATDVYSLDRTMVAAGQALGLPMNRGFPAAT